MKKIFTVFFLTAVLLVSSIFSTTYIYAAENDENPISVNKIIKTKNTNSVSIKNGTDCLELKSGITVKKVKVLTKNANIYAGKNVSVLNLLCQKKNAKVFVEALDGTDITVNLKKKTVLTVSGSKTANVKINVFCSGCTVVSDIPVSVNSSFPVGFNTSENLASLTNRNFTGSSALEKIYDINWWIENRAEDRTILTAEEIKAFNKANIGSPCGLKDLGLLQDLTVADVCAMIEDYSFPSKEYVHDRKITEEEKAEILDNRNLPDLNAENSGDNTSSLDKISVRYAVTTENTSIRAFPTDIFLTNEVGKYDYMQETGINYDEPLLVLWDSKDGEWSFVQAYDYNGWMKKSSFGFCDKEEFDGLRNAIYNGEVFCAVKTGEIEFYEFKAFFRMGTYLPFKDGKITIIERNSEGNATFTSLDSPIAIPGMRLGFADLTEKNLTELAGNALGTPYSWGDIDESGMDCSSTLQGVFKCFGLLLPRNSSQQIKLSAEIVNLSEISAEEKLKKISELPLGSILYMPGHVMMYLGEYNGVPYIIHNTTDSARDDQGTTVFDSCVLTSIGVGKSGYTLFDRITYAVVFSS